MNNRSRQPKGVPTGGQFAAEFHSEAETVALCAPPSTLHRAIDSVIEDYEARMERIDEADPMDDLWPAAVDQEMNIRHAAYRETVDRLRILRDAGIEEGELAAAVEGLGQELKARGRKAGGSGAHDVLAGIGAGLISTSFEHRDPEAQLERRRAKIRALKGLQFDDADFPAGHILDRHVARLKLSGITGTVRKLQARGKYGKDLAALVETADGRSYRLEMTHSALTVTRDRDEPGPGVSVDLGLGTPITPGIVAEVFAEARRRAVMNDAWTRSTRMRDSDQGADPAVSFADYTVIEDGDVTVAAVTAVNSIGRYRIERLRSKATGECETRVQALGADESRVSTRMTEAILADLSEAGGGEGSGAAFTRDLDLFAAAVLSDPGYRAG